jgi:nitrogen-specific signal transduction histidine kinase
MSKTPSVDGSDGPRSSAALSRMLIILMGLIVLSFLSAFGAARIRGSTVDRDLDGIVHDAMPSVVLLSSARGDLHRLNGYAGAYVDSAAEELAIPAEPIARYRQAVDAAFTSYLALPSFPDEKELDDQVPPRLSALDAALARALEAVNDRDLATAASALRDERRAAEDTDDLLQRLTELNAREGQRLGLSVGVKRQRAIHTMATMDCFAVLFSLAATALAVMLVRRSTHLLEDQRDELSRFAGRVAHDVTSPLSSLSLSLELLARRTQGDPTAQTTARRGLASVRRASRIAGDLLEFSRAGARANPTATADLKAVLEDVVDGLRLEALSAGVELSLHPVEPCAIACSPGVLMSLTTNVVRNAIKHMGESTVRRVEVSVIALGDRRRVQVADTGPGISLELRERLFEPFARGETTSSGVGLGLATVRRLAEAHGGRADFRSEPGHGALFWFDLPVARKAGRPRIASLVARLQAPADAP